jgi:hypothetical protein
MSPRTKLARALGYLGALPVSALAAAVVPLVIATGGSVRARSGVLEAAGGLLRPLLARGVPRFPIAAITLGHVVFAADERALEASRAHERIHVEQYERFGALFPLLYIAASLRAMLRGGRAYRDNVFEQEACLRSGEVKAA